MTRYPVIPPNVYGFGHKAYYDYVIACLRDGAEQLVDGATGRKSLELISANYESVETDEEVTVGTRLHEGRLGTSSL